MSAQARAGLRVTRIRLVRSRAALLLRGSEGGEAGGGPGEFRVERKATVGVNQRFGGDHIWG